jgi:peroxin-1
LHNRNVTFETDLIESILNHSDGFVFKDIEKLIDQIILNNWNSSPDSNEPIDAIIKLKENNNQAIVYNYTCINMLETKFYKSKNEISWNLVGGLNQIKASLIESIIWPIKYKALYKKLLMKQSTGVLLYGPSGCGKTLIASALANESKFNFISVKGPELLSKYIGNSEQNVRELFSKAEKAKPCIIFFDEFDSLAPKRGHDSTGVTDRVVNQLLTQLDGVEGLDGVYLLAATSRPDLIDQALLRPGRIDTFLYIGYPEIVINLYQNFNYKKFLFIFPNLFKEEKKNIFKIYSNDLNFNEDVDFDVLCQYCEDFTGADIKAVVCDALLKAFHRMNKVKNVKALSAEDENEMLRQSCSMDFDCNEDELKKLIRIQQEDFLLSINSIKESINQNERQKLKRM